MPSERMHHDDFEKALSALINVSEALKEKIKSEDLTKAVELSGARDQIAHQLFALPWSESKVQQHHSKLEIIDQLDREITSVAAAFKAEVEQQIKDVQAEKKDLSEQMRQLSKGQSAINAYDKARKAFR
ncbi:hypothetical protein BFW38_12195 [Terasakiispira papahanaumokuakeensis]|uniref:Uncharacterized protein n=1 Tax=Terasakiispira papahanaumokuakeensis TaxID=197479 RepID=A0A1E2VB24_9GAMM|nr:hypothetical protein [Terasakiispira papahanaumokuakeensis]ODC04174.1 hypothetical protein BFW38_12195 [Terasakiispira papahanaumokuakeensis]